MKVRGIQAVGESTDEAGWNTQRSAKGNCQMSEIPADPNEFGNGVERGSRWGRGAREILDPFIDPIADPGHPIEAGFVLVELAFRESGKQIRLTKTTRIEENQGIGRNLFEERHLKPARISK